MKRPIYLDYNATTPVDPAVVAAMVPYLGTHFGNPSSKRHVYGWTADEACGMAREDVAALVGAEPEWVHFTGGATEAINWAIKGIAFANVSRGKHIVTVATEHKAVIGSCQWLESLGWEVSILEVDANGVLDVASFEAALRDDTVLACFMWANNEIGTLHPVADLTRSAHSRGIPVLVDATQAVGKVPVELGDIDLLACSAHKFYGPKGVGALVINGRRPRLRLDQLIHGGGQERGRRAGTLNVASIVGMGAAARMAREDLAEEGPRLAEFRDRMEAALAENVDVIINGEGAERLPNTANVTFPGVDTAKLLERLPELAISTGSACSTGSGAPSHVLKAIGSDLQSVTLRVSFGRFTKDEDAEAATHALVRAVKDLQDEASEVAN
ncbi:MAG: cysteine desulfurase [Rhodothermales bacterium]|nr:cysteine desulfurase [Rhodothermales bacterium]